mmetsp:Transcript_76258/g.216112  ORF Transcript_76258/g.216112 Transcript_76258/m.216112 type:complete len:320 (+) Transcript_76258:892-1851(+)
MVDVVAQARLRDVARPQSVHLAWRRRGVRGAPLRLSRRAPPDAGQPPPALEHHPHRGRVKEALVRGLPGEEAPLALFQGPQRAQRLGLPHGRQEGVRVPGLEREHPAGEVLLEELVGRVPGEHDPLAHGQRLCGGRAEDIGGGGVDERGVGPQGLVGVVHAREEAEHPGVGRGVFRCWAVRCQAARHRGGADVRGVRPGAEAVDADGGGLRDSLAARRQPEDLRPHPPAALGPRRLCGVPARGGRGGRQQVQQVPVALRPQRLAQEVAAASSGSVSSSSSSRAPVPDLQESLSHSVAVAHHLVGQLHQDVGQLHVHIHI